VLDAESGAVREQVTVDGTDLSLLTSGEPDARPLLMVHGTFWSKVWAPVMDSLGRQFRCVAVDLPGFGRSGGELTPEQATVPALAAVVGRAADALGFATFDLAGHDIGAESSSTLRPRPTGWTGWC